MSERTFTKEQGDAIGAMGKVMVSASAGSGKTTVMIEKLAREMENGVDLDNVLAVTFTKKAAAQMKEKLRKNLIERVKNLKTDESVRTRLKAQLPKIVSADISTIHSFCARLLRTYFYAVSINATYGIGASVDGEDDGEIGIDGGFDIIAADDAVAKRLKERVLNLLFDRYYEAEPMNASFKILLDCYRRKRGDGYLKELILSCYDEVRMNDEYVDMLKGTDGVYTDAGFEAVCAALKASMGARYARLAYETQKFRRLFVQNYDIHPDYEKILFEMQKTLENAVDCDIFAAQTDLTATKKPIFRAYKAGSESEAEWEKRKDADDEFKAFKDEITARYKAIGADICSEQMERERFFKSGEIAKAFAKVLIDFNREYTLAKLDENKLDYNDLEHLTLSLLKDNEELRTAIREKYKRVYVDEYQDVNPVQERIIENVSGSDRFFVGDVKQAIYGFRGSKSKFFDEKLKNIQSEGGVAVHLPHNFRSAPKLISFVNDLFGEIMTELSCGLNYKSDNEMVPSELYDKDAGIVGVVFSDKREQIKEELKVYSVKRTEKSQNRYSAEAEKILQIVKSEIGSLHYDTEKKELVRTTAGDICILTRKRNKAASEIARALQDAGYSVSGAQDDDLTSRPEIKQLLDILGYIDNKQQDIPLATALLSPIGSLSCDELATIRLEGSRSEGRGAQRVSFRECCKNYIRYNDDETAKKLRAFRKRIEDLRSCAQVLSAAEMIDKILGDTGLDASFAAGTGERLKNARRLAEEGEGISVCALLEKLKSGYEIVAPSSASSDSIKLMTMHASKGLEFPVVIIADICATFKGRDFSELPLDTRGDKNGTNDATPFKRGFAFAPKVFDDSKMLTYETILRRLIKDNDAIEDLKNELNLFYVACTRAQCNLYILAEKQWAFNPAKAIAANCYADLFSCAKRTLTFISRSGAGDFEKEETDGEYDEELYKKIEGVRSAEYNYKSSSDLPVKSSASAILKMSEEDRVCVHQAFGGEGETGTERGIAYHKFLELCDFNICDDEGIKREIGELELSGRMSSEQKALLDVFEIKKILNLPIFAQVKNARLKREQVFLCGLPAYDIFGTIEKENGNPVKDELLLQGAIDLLAHDDTGYVIVDYKYSKKSADELIQSYRRQLELYKKAVARITKTHENRIRAVIVNIYLKQQIEL